MNDKIKKHIVAKLRELADKVELSETDIVEMSTFGHYKPCLVVEQGMFIHNPTGDIAIQIRVKGKGKGLGPICVDDIK